MEKIKVIVATHKKYIMPEDRMYLPLQVGNKENNIGFQKDCEGENISDKNKYYCELTGLYWAWKNANAEYIGLSHYRRYFSKSRRVFKSSEYKIKNVLSYSDAIEIFKDTNIILPKKRNYFIENLYSHYQHTMYIEPLNKTREIIEERFPKYLYEFDNLHKRSSAHMFNMFIMKKEILNEYCTWLFDILFELEKRIDINKYNSFHSRFFGRVSELLLDVWINTNDLSYKEVNVIDIENINWFKKGFSFLKAKFLSKKYEKSF